MIARRQWVSSDPEPVNRPGPERAPDEGQVAGGGLAKEIAVSEAQNTPEIIEIDSETVACDGGGGALGHPRVWLNARGKGAVDCPYCDRQYVLRPA